MITPIKKENATDQIYMQLLDMIFTGSWSAGSKKFPQKLNFQTIWRQSGSRPRSCSA